MDEGIMRACMGGVFLVVAIEGVYVYICILYTYITHIALWVEDPGGVYIVLVQILRANWARLARSRFMISTGRPSQLDPKPYTLKPSFF